MSLSEEDFFKPLDIPTEDVKTPAQWIFITAAHTSVHVGKIQLLRTLVEKSYEDPC